jgi:hypothetical protein
MEKKALGIVRRVQVVIMVSLRVEVSGWLQPHHYNR